MESLNCLAQRRLAPKFLSLAVIFVFSRFLKNMFHLWEYHIRFIGIRCSEASQNEHALFREHREGFVSLK